MKHILFFFLLLPFVAFAQWPAAPNKIRLGNQTTGDGLVVRTAASPSWTPSSINNAWLAFDTVAVKLYYYDGGAWNEYTGGSEITDVSVSNDTLYITTTDSTFVAVFDDANTNFANSNLTFTGNRVHNLSTRTLTIADGGTYPTYQQSAATDAISLYSTAKDFAYFTPGLVEMGSDAQLNILADDTITVTASRIRLNAADTRIQQVAKDNALNRLVALDSLTGQLKYIDKSSISSGGSVTGTGTTGTIPVWSSSSALGDSPLTVSSGSVIAGGTGFFRFPAGTTAQRPGTPAAGETRYNTTNGVLEYYGASAWEVPVNSASATGLGTAGRVFYADANGRAAADDDFGWDATNNRFFIGTTSTSNTVQIQNATGQTSFRVNSYGNTGADSGECLFARARGTAASSSTVSAGDRLFRIISQGRDASQFRTSSEISAWVDGTVSSANVPGRITFSTVPVGGGTTAVERMVIKADGKIGIGTSTPSQIFHVKGQVQIDTITQTGASIAGFTGTSGTGVLTRLALGSGLSLSSGTLSATGVSDNLYTANGTLSGARTVTLGTNTLLFSGTPSGGAPASTNFQIAPGTGSGGTISMQAANTSLSNTAVSITDARFQAVATNVTGGTANTFEVFPDSTKMSPTPINENNALTRMLAINSSTGRIQYRTARTITAGSGISVTNGDGVSGNPTISRTYSLIHATITGGSTFFGTTAERPDNDTPGSATTSAVGSDFSVSGSTVDYTGGSGALIRVEGSISFSVADDGDYYLSLYKEGTEIGATSMRITCTAGNYYSVSLPATTVTGNTNDTFDLRIATVSGNSTTTMHRYGYILERIY